MPFLAGSQRLALLSLGEIGGAADLSSLPAAYEAATAALSGGAGGASSEEVRSAASLALGGITRGNLAAFLPGLLKQASSGGLGPWRTEQTVDECSQVVFYSKQAKSSRPWCANH